MGFEQVGSLTMSLFSGWLGSEQQKIQNIVLDAEAAASNTIREGRNIENAAVAGFANWMTSENNNRRLNAAGAQRTAGVQTLQRQRQAAARDSLESQLSDAEAAGAYAANAAMNGAAGASVDVIDMAMRLKQQRATQYRKSAAAYQDYDTKQQIAGIVPQAIAGLDIGQANAGIDYGQTFSRARPVQGNWLLDTANWAAQNPQAAGQLTQTTGNFFSQTSQPSKYSISIPSQSSYGLQSEGGLGFRMQ